MEKKFTTVINCMDGRIQSAIIEYMQNTYEYEYVDMITAAGPSLVLAENTKKDLIENIKFRLNISVEKHFSKVVAVVGHFDCAAIIMSDEEQMEVVKKATDLVETWHDDLEVIGLWVSSDLEVTKIN